LDSISRRVTTHTVRRGNSAAEQDADELVERVVAANVLT
jgi:hypothetical protein